MLNSLRMISFVSALCAVFYFIDSFRVHPCGCQVSIPPSRQALAPLWAALDAPLADGGQQDSTRAAIKEFLAQYDFLSRVLAGMQALEQCRAFTGITYMANMGVRAAQSLHSVQIPELRALLVTGGVSGMEREAVLGSLKAAEAALGESLECLPCMDRRFTPWREDQPLTSAYDLEDKWRYAMSVLEYAIAHETDVRQKEMAARLRESMIEQIPDLALLVSIQMELASVRSNGHDVKGLEKLKNEAIGRLKEFAAPLNMAKHSVPRGVLKSTLFFITTAIDIHADGKYEIREE